MDMIQWNINGIKSHYEELQLLLTEHQPIIFAIQESHLKIDQQINIKNYDIHRKDRPDIQHASGGVATLVRKDTHSENVPLNTIFEAVAVNIYIPHKITICNIYIPPNFNFSSEDIEDLINQLHTSYMLLGDFNAHNTIWGCETTNRKGNIIENLLDLNNVALLNDGHPTHLSSATGKLSAIDLSLIHPKIYLEYTWQVLSDLHSSDHFPIVIKKNLKNNKDNYTPKYSKWNTKKANWENFSQHLQKAKFDFHLNDNINLLVEDFTTKILHAAKISIPKKKK